MAATALRAARSSTWALLLAGVLVSVGLAHWQADRNRADIAAETGDLAARIVERSLRQLDQAEFGLSVASAYVSGAGIDEVDAQNFARFSLAQDLNRMVPGLVNIGLVRRVAPEAEADFVARMRQGGSRDFEVRRPRPHDGERRIVQWVVPAAEVQGVVGMDTAALPERRAAGERALATGLTSLSAPMALVKPRADGARGLLMFRSLPAAPARHDYGIRAGAPGLLFARIELDQLLNVESLRLDRVAMRLADVTDPAQPVDFNLPNGAPDDRLHLDATVTMEREVGGRRWRFTITPRESLVQSLHLTAPVRVGGIGLLVTALVALLWRMWLRLRESMLLATAERLRLMSLLDHVGDAFIGLTLDGRVTIWNQAAERLFAYSAAEAIGRPLAELTLAAEFEAEEAHFFREAEQGRHSSPIETRRRHRDGSLIDVEIAAGPMYDERGRVMGVVKVVRSVHERVEQRRQLQAWAERLEAEVAARTDELRSTASDLRNVLDAMPALVSSWDDQLRNRFANRAYASHFGTTPDALRGSEVAQLLGEAWFAETGPRMRAALAGEEQRFERDVLLADGSMHRSQVHFVPHRDGDRVVGFYALVHDISAITQARQRLVDILDGTQAGAWEWDLADDRLQVNERWAAMVGLPPQDLQEARLADWRARVHPDDLPTLQRYLCAEPEALAFEFEVRLRHAEGHDVWTLVRGQAVARTPGGRPVGMAGIQLDITQRKQAEQARLRSERMLARTGQIARTGGWEYVVATGELLWSDETCRLHGMPPGHRPSRDEAIDCYAVEVRPLVRSLVERALREGTGWDAELPLVRANGEMLWVRSLGGVDCDGDQVVRLVGALQDISDERAAKLALLRQQAMTEALLQSAPVAVCVSPLAGGRASLVNRRYCDLVERPRDAAMALDLAQLYVEPQAHARLCERLARGEEIADELVELQAPGRPQGERVWALASYRQIEFQGENAVLAWLYDVSELRQAREEAQRAQQLLRGAVDAIDEAFVVYDPDDRLVLCNEKYRQVYWKVADLVTPGVAFEALIRAGAELGQYPVAGGDVDAWVRERMRQHRQANSQLVQELDDGRVLRISERRLADGHVVGFRVDITELERARKEAESASHAKSEFLAVASHEIRTPLNAILGVAYLLERADLPPAQQAQARQITQAGRALLALLNDVLDFSKIEAGQLELEAQPFELRAMVDNEVTLLAGAVRPGGPQVRVAVEAGLPTVVQGDALRLRQVLRNLLGNALKFTERGEVTVRLRRGEAAPWVEIEVADTGIGIDAATQARLFQPFVQADASTTRRFGGTGLGLSISGHLVELMGGRITLDSTPGVGSTFTVSLPLPEADRPAPDADAGGGMARLPGCTVLVVDDSDINLDVAAQVLALEGAQAVTCTHGQAALDLVQARAADFDAVLLDVQMPGMDGIEVVRRLRELLGAPAGERTLPVIALSAGVRREEREAALRAGMSDFLSKPLDPDALTACLRQHIERYRGQSPGQVRRESAPMPLAVAGPGIEGLEDGVIASSLRADPPLLLSMIRRLIGQFADLRDRAHPELPARLHKLRGSASVVGATTLSATARALESDLRAGRDDEAARHFAQLQGLMDALTQAASVPLQRESERLDALRRDEALRLAGATQGLDAAALARLRELVDSQSMRAAEQVEAQAAAIAVSLGIDGLARLRRALEDFDFQAAADALVV